MQVKVMNEAGFQILTSAMSIGPSRSGYVLEVSADGKNFSPLFSVAANTTKMATGLAPNAYYRLKGNVGEVIVNWSRSCVIDGEGGSGTTYTAGDYISLAGDVISVTGITPDLYATSADVQTMINTKAADYTPTSGFSTINGSAITDGSAIVIEAGDVAPLSAAVETLSAATVGKADAVSITENPARPIFPKWNSQGIITGEYAVANMGDLRVNGTNKQVFFFGTGSKIATFYAPNSAGTAGDILVSTGNGAPVWATDDKVSSTSVSTIWKGTQAEYDAITTKDPNTFYIIVSN